FMDFLATNANGSAVWSDRTRPARWSYNYDGNTNGYWWQGRGGPFEHCVEYCNETGKDLWICVPHKADDDFITKLAQLVRYGSDGNLPYTSGDWNDPSKVHKGLNPELKVYVEYSNEVWNT